MNELLSRYEEMAGREAVSQLVELAAPLQGAKIVHVNSTREGGGVAEILRVMIPLMESLGLSVRWEVMEGTPDFFHCTKGFHNAIQGARIEIKESLLQEYERVNGENAERLRPVLEEADFVFIHDPQPAHFLRFIPSRRGKWVWRCHIDCSHPNRRVWNYIKGLVQEYDASIFSLPQFARQLPHTQYLIPPSIDPLSEKNIGLPQEEINGVFDRFGLKQDIPLLIQVSRFDRFKDPIGVISAYREIRKMIPVQLVLAGSGATDDPEGAIVLDEVREAAAGDPDIHILLLPATEHRTINALQRAADIVIQKSIREGFGLTVTEGMWKGKPVIGGDTGGIRLQVVDHYTGFRVKTPEGAALRIRYLLHNRKILHDMGETARRFVRENFLITRHVRDYLALMLGLLHSFEDRIDLSEGGVCVL